MIGTQEQKKPSKSIKKYDSAHKSMQIKRVKTTGEVR